MTVVAEDDFEEGEEGVAMAKIVAELVRVIEEPAVEL